MNACLDSAVQILMGLKAKGITMINYPKKNKQANNNNKTHTK